MELVARSDPTTHPLIYPEYCSKPEDLHALARSVQRMRDMMAASAIRGLIEEELAPGPIANDQTSIEADIRDGIGHLGNTGLLVREQRPPGRLLSPGRSPRRAAKIASETTRNAREAGLT